MLNFSFIWLKGNIPFFSFMRVNKTPVFQIEHFFLIFFNFCLNFRLACPAVGALHPHLQRFCHDDALQRDQRPEDPRPAERVQRRVHKPHLLRHLVHHFHLPGNAAGVDGFHHISE